MRKAIVKTARGGLVAVLLLATAWAAMPEARAQNGTLTLEQAVAKIKKKGVRVLTANELEVDGRMRYRIKYLDSKGRVRTVYIDAKR